MEILVTPIEAHRIILVHPQAYDSLALAEAVANVPQGTKLTDLYPNGIIAVFRNGELLSIDENLLLPLPSTESGRTTWEIRMRA